MTTAAPASLSVRPGSLHAWILAARPATLTAAVAPVLVGTAAAHAAGGARIGTALAALFGAIWIQIGTNFANDVFDFEKGADREDRLGPVRATQAGLLTPSQVRVGMIVSMVLATLAGAYLASVAGWPVVAIGVASILSGIAYTGGPWPLGYNGLGDLFVFVFFGFVAVVGSTFVQRLEAPAVAWLAAVPVGAVATAVLVVNNARDHRTDVVCGKRTLVVRFGRRAGTVEYAVLMICAQLAAPALAWLRASPWPLLALLSAPLALANTSGVARADGAALNPYLGKTARLLLLQGALLSVGLALTARS